MPYQDRHALDAAETFQARSSDENRSDNSGRNIQIAIIAGLVLAILIGIFGSF